MRSNVVLVLTLALPALAQTLDEAYTAKIREYTTEKFFSTELVDHLPASAVVPTPQKVLGHIAGAPDVLTYSKDIYRYMRELGKATPRVKVFTAGVTEEGREHLLVAVSDEANIRKLDEYKGITARLADPRQTPEDEARRLIGQDVAFYYVAGSIHSPETGAPEMLMELAYRLAVEETPFLQAIRRNSVVLITPVIEVDGRDRAVDLYRWKKANPGKAAPSLLYWGKYVAHDNNRDGIGLSLALSRIMLKNFLDWHPVVMHDLHESVPFLYTSTGTGPYNAWLDPIVEGEWQELAFYEIDEMTKRGVPGVWTHGFYDGWGANYMLSAAQGHNGIGRFYETFGGRDADTAERTIPPAQTTRQWYRPNPPLAKVNWSLRDNVNLQQSALLLALRYVADHKDRFLENFYVKSRRSVAKAYNEGPAAYVIPGDDPRPLACAGLVNLLELQGVEVHRAEREILVGKQKFPAGSYVVRMDQPYSREADMLLDTQYYNPRDPAPYDDTGWTLGPLRNVKTVRVTDTAILQAPMTRLDGPAVVRGSLDGPPRAAAFLIRHNAENALATLRFRLRDIAMDAAEESFTIGGHEYPAGSFIVPQEGNPADLRARLAAAAEDLGLRVAASSAVPGVKRHPLAAPRIALVHTWQNTQAEGWYRIAFDRLNIPYTYISDHALRDTEDLRARFDVIILGPVNGAPARVVNGIRLRGAPIPWQSSDLTPNIGMSPDTTADMRGGMGLEGLLHVRRFVEAGGLFVTVGPNDAIPIDFGLVEGVSVAPARELQARGGVYNAVVADRGSPIAYGYEDRLPVYFNQSPVLQVSLSGGMGGRAGEGSNSEGRPSGRGGPDDPDIPQGRPYVSPLPRPQLKPGEEPPLSDEMREYLRAYLPPPEARPRVVLRFPGEKDLWVSGMLAGGRELANHPAVVDVPSGRGHVLLFANNPVWRQQTQGSFFLLFNAILNYDHLDAGDARRGSSPAAGLQAGAAARR